MTTPESTFDLNLYMHALLQEEPFFAAVSRQINKRSTTSIQTAAMAVTEDGFIELLYNPEFMQKMLALGESTKDKHAFTYIRGIIKHEFYHFFFGHLTDRMPEGGISKTWNIAMDLAINCHISDELPPIACIPGHGIFSDIPPFLTSEAYYEMLKKEQEEGGDGSPGRLDDADSLDDHSGFGDGGDTPDGAPSLAT